MPALPLASRATFRATAIRTAAVGLALAVGLAGCGLLTSPVPSSLVLPKPTCGGAKIAIPGALSCERLVVVAIEVLGRETPAQLDRGILAIDVNLQGCPRSEVPPQIDCTGEDWAQLVTITFGPARGGGPMEPSLTVALAPVSGRLLGIANPLIR